VCHLASGACRGDEDLRCEADEQCLPALACRPTQLGEDRERTCQPAGGPGALCDHDGHCEDGQCSHAGRCAGADGHECLDESGCLPGFRCLPDGGRQACGPQSDPGGPCDQDGDCLRGPCGTDGLCLQELGGECRVDAACPGDRAVCFNHDEEGGKTCERPQAEAGTPCRRDKECGSGLTCLDHTCKGEEPGVACGVPDHCAPTLRCRGSRCEFPGREGELCAGPDGAPEDRNCGEDLMCNNGSMVCVTPGSVPEGGRCGRHVECWEGLDCNGRAGRCQTPD